MAQNKNHLLGRPLQFGDQDQIKALESLDFEYRVGGIFSPPYPENSVTVICPHCGDNFECLFFDPKNPNQLDLFGNELQD